MADPTQTQLADYAGAYQASSGPRMTVEPGEQFLICTMEGQGVADFFPEAKDIFFSKIMNITITFQRDERDKVVGLAVDMFGQKIQARKLE